MTRPLAAGGFFFYRNLWNLLTCGNILKTQVNRVPGSGVGIPRGGGRRKPHPANLKVKPENPQ